MVELAQAQPSTRGEGPGQAPGEELQVERRSQHSAVCKWSIANFAQAKQKTLWSKFVEVGGYDCRLLVYPSGAQSAAGPAIAAGSWPGTHVAGPHACCGAARLLQASRRALPCRRGSAVVVHAAPHDSAGMRRWWGGSAQAGRCQWGAGDAAGAGRCRSQHSGGSRRMQHQRVLVAREQPPCGCSRWPG